MRLYRKYTNGIYQVPKIQKAHFAELENGRRWSVAGPYKDNKIHDWDAGLLLPPVLID